MNINKIFILTKYNLDILNLILKFARPNRTFKSKTSKLIKDALQYTDREFNPIIYINSEYVIFWKNRNKMPLGIYYVYRKWQKNNFYERWCNK